MVIWNIQQYENCKNKPTPKKKKGRNKFVSSIPQALHFCSHFWVLSFLPFYWPLYQNIIGMIETEAKTHINLKTTVLFIFVIKYFMLFLVNSDFLNNKHQRDLYCNSFCVFSCLLAHCYFISNTWKINNNQKKKAFSHNNFQTSYRTQTCFFFGLISLF